MSLGSDYGPADDPENDFVDALAKIGVVTVVASGNAGDATDIGGTPGNATASLTVANSVGDSFAVRRGRRDRSSAAVHRSVRGAEHHRLRRRRRHAPRSSTSAPT